MSVVIPTGKIATVKISYGAYGTGDDYRLTVNSTAQANPTTKLTNEMTNAQVIASMKEITLISQTGTLTLGISNTSKSLYIGRVSAVITGYTVSYDKGSADGASGSLASGTKTAGSSFTLSSSSSAFTRSGYTYDGWSVNEDGSTKDYNLGGSYTTDAPVTLYPHWVADASATITATLLTPAYMRTGASGVQIGVEITGASTGWYYRVRKGGGYETPDNTTYTTTTWTMTSTIGDGANTYTVELYNGSGTKMAESNAVEVTGETGHPMTIAAGEGGSASPASTWANGDHLQPEITATPSSGYHFVNWTKNNENATLENANAATTTITSASGACTITANFEADDACPTAASGEVVYKFVTKSSGLGTSAICANKDQDYPLSTGDGNPLETLTNGTLTARASTAGTSNLKYNKGSINFNGGSSGWLIIGLDCPIKSGDVIRYVNSNSGSVAIRTAKGTSENEIVLAGNGTTEVQTVVISSAQATAFNELTTVYMVRKSNTSDISYFEIIRPYTITLDANTNGGKINGENTEVHYALSGEHLTLPRPTKAGERFKGWYDAASGGSVVSRDYAPTGTIRLYAQWEDCPASGTVYKWEVKSGLTNGSLSAGVSGEADIDATTVNYLSTLIGGEATIHNKNNHIKISDNSRFAFDDNAPYIKVDLECPLRTGDKFKSTVYSNTFWVNASTTRANVAELPTGSLQETDVPAALVGQTTLYIWRGGGNGKISYFEVTRTSATFDLTYDGNGQTSVAGTVPSAVEDQAYDAEITLEPVGSLAKTNYTFGGWNTEDDGTGTNYEGGATFTIKDNTTLYAKWTQAVTLDGTTNGGSDGSATAVWNATALTGFTAATPPSGNKCTGYFDAAEGGNKILNSDGTYSSSNVTNYVTSGKWSRTGAAPTLYAQYESSGSLIWNLGVNTNATSLTTDSKSSAFTEISTANMSNATVNGLTYTGNAKASLTGKISTPAYDADKYVYVTFQVAAGYKFIPSNIKVPVQPVGEGEHKAVELRLTDESSHSLSGSATKCDGTSSGKTTTVTLSGDGSKYFTGTVTLKIYVYPHADASAASYNCYRFGTPITIEGAVETACTMPSFTGLSYEDTEYTPGATASAITVTNPEDVTTYAWKQNETNDRTGTTPAAGTNNEQSYTPTTSSEGTMYYWCELSNACGTVKTAAVAITVAADKTATTVTWTNPASTPNYGGGGYTIRATVDDASWNGNAADLTITAPAGIRIYGKTSGTDNGKQYVEVKFDVQTAFDRTTYADNIPFTVSHAETATYDAIADENDVTYSACAGGGGEGSAFVEVTSAVTTAKTGMSNYWEAVGVGRLNKAYNQAMGSSADAQTIEGHSFSYRTGANNSNWMVNPYIAGVTKIRLYFYASAAITSGKLGISKVLYDTEYFSSQGSRSVVYDDVATNADSYAAADKGWIEFTLPEMAANSYCYFSTNTGNLYVYGVELFSGSVGSGGSQTTNLTWSQDVDESDAKKVTKKTTDAYFTITANRADAVTRESLGAITYSSSVPSVATVDPSTGKVSMVAAGTTIIKATLAASGCFKKKEITYKLVVEEEECSIAAGTLTLTSGSETKCSSHNVTLTLTGFESGADIQWKDGDTDINDGGNYTITKNGTTSTLTTNQAGTYSVIVRKGCFVRSNRITIKNASAEASVSKIIDEWYIKQGRLTPDIALFNAVGATSFAIKDASTDAEVTSIAGCTFELQDDVIYLHGYSTAGVGPTGIESAANETIKVVVTDACGNEASVGNIIIHKQIQTDKHVLAFVVVGKANGGFTEDIPANRTTSVELYNTIAENFDVQATNIKATDDEKVLKQYYSQFDILCITDYPNTGDKGNVAKQSYVNAIGSLIDIRPILTMEAFVAKLSNWAAKGISGTPKSPCPRQYSMDLQCKDHEIFSGTEMVKIGEGDDEMYRVTMVDKSKADYSTKDGNEECSKAYDAGGYPALQGFTIGDIGSDMLPLGLIYDGETPLQVGIERQYEMSARLMVLGIQQKAMERLTKDGQTVVINALKYLMKKNEEDIADCSIAFYGGTEGHETDWNTDSNWKGGKKPDKTAREIRILAPVVITGEQSIHAQAPIKIAPNDGGTYNGGADNARGSLTIAAGGALRVDGKIQAVTAPAYNRPRATAPADLTIGSTETNGNGTLIFDNEDGSTQAIVQYYSKATTDEADTWNWQYMAVPFNDNSSAYRNYYDSYLYRWKEDCSGWEVVENRGEVYPWVGYTITQVGAKTYVMDGTLVETGEMEFTVPEGKNLVVGNSWTAPIQVKQFEDADFAGMSKNVYLFNTGYDPKGEGTFDKDDGRYEGGTYVTVPIHASSYTGDSLISSLQAFIVYAKADEGGGTFTLNYDRHIRPARTTDNLSAGPMHAPKRGGVISDKPAVLKVWASGSRYDDRLVVLEREDFSTGLDEGWDGNKRVAGNSSPLIFAVTDNGREAVSAIPTMEGTLIGFWAGEDNEYTLHFEYDEEDELYLLDLDNNIYTPVNSNSTYVFTVPDKKAHNRFILTYNAPDPVATGVEETQANEKPEAKAIKFLKDEKVFIFVNGKLYDATGKVVK